jgi:NhaP-type Na+/H+ or K+/H+ antiporter
VGVLAAAAPHDFDVVLAVLGGLLVVGALIAGVARRSFVSLTAVFVLAGLVLGDGGLEVVHFDAQSGFVTGLATVALVAILFRDGLEVEQEMLQRAWRLPFRKLILAMPITCGLVACATKLLTDLDWTESFLVGALLSPTDPVLSSSVVTNPRVPRVIRHSLNLESGLNDGLALPAVLALASSLDPQEAGFVWWKFVLQDLSVGLATGLLVGYLASVLMPRSRALRTEISQHQKALFALGVAFASYGIAVLPPHGNGLIAAFVCAIVLGIRRPDIRAAFETRSEEVIELVKLGIFVVFGSLLTLDGLFGDGGAGLAIAVFTLLAARPLAVFVSLAGTKTDGATRGFMGWFGPKGVATMTFALLVLSQGIAHGGQIFNIASVAVLISILAHGLSDHAGANWIAARAERDTRHRAEVAA